jgi:hypothetical protein
MIERLGSVFEHQDIVMAGETECEIFESWTIEIEIATVCEDEAWGRKGYWYDWWDYRIAFEEAFECSFSCRHLGFVDVQSLAVLKYVLI